MKEWADQEVRICRYHSADAAQIGIAVRGMALQGYDPPSSTLGASADVHVQARSWIRFESLI